MNTSEGIDSAKIYYVKVDDEYVEVENPIVEDISNYYELILEESWTRYNGDINKLTQIDRAGFSQAIMFTNDSLGNEQRLLISSAVSQSEEKVGIEVDPHFLSLAVKSDDMSPLELRMDYDVENNLGEMNIRTGEENILSIKDENNYMLDITSGIKMNSIGMFRYKGGLAIGAV